MPPERWSSAMASSISRMIDGWMPSVGSSSTSSFGRVTRARAMASCWACPPDSSPGGPVEQGPQAGEHVEGVVDRLGIALAVALEHHPQVLPRREVGEHLVALGHVADARPGPGRCGHAR